MADILVTILKVLAVSFSALLCLAGVALSAISISGTWLVSGAAVILGFALARPFPGVWTVVVFLALSAAVEVVEALASAWGVQARGGSRWAGAASVLGGMVGLVLGAAIPVPIMGPLIGMVAGSFLAAFAVESARDKKRREAAHVAWGTVLARVAVILVKVAVTVGMVAYLGIGLVLSTAS